MLLSSIVKLSNFHIDIRSFRKEISDEVEKYKQLLKRKGSRISVSIIEDDDIAKVKVEQLFTFYKSGQLDEYEISYIADALSLSESFPRLDEKDAYVIESLILES